MKKLFLFAIPLSVCNLRCHYCYLTKRPSYYEGIIPEMKYSPDKIAYAMRQDRVGGPCYFNFCADGETLLLPNIEQYVGLLAKEGHFIEIVSNMLLTKQLETILSLDVELLKHISFKCSFHYLQLLEKKQLEKFAENVNRASEAGASVNLEVTPSDELIPYIDELKSFSLEHFGALPHFTIARDDSTRGIERLTSLSEEEYYKIWSTFNSEFFDFKTEIFGVRRKEFCYAGAWSYYVNMATGNATQCYGGRSVGDIFENPDEPLPNQPIGRCPVAHCYNGHALLSMGIIPNLTDVRYGDIRDRERDDGTHWLTPEVKCFFNQRVFESNDQIDSTDKTRIAVANTLSWIADGLGRKIKRPTNSK